ncbi:FecR family protein [Tenacibaculum sp. IB213877]|uniref:FecR family protein n=1 Tax=Tenacibaculum sp. IB213877 TaxID=3097351 RepID=UPI002A59E7B4|nr:FecR family protein [Tenacibaculum sp. IB213877]MDY0781542.1 FecR family protein [Tenacibaculum sp. IB213877]
MNREDLIKKWLDNDLNAEELKAFEALEDYTALTKIANYSKGFKAPEYDSEKALKTVLEKINTKKAPTNNWLNTFMKIAAVFVVSLGFYLYNISKKTHFTTQFAEKTEISLPDKSVVNLNAHSSLSFRKRNWDTNRNIKLTGEAFFKVQKGSTFNVHTTEGTVTVLGTQFNVKQRARFFEVTCYEGAVQVSYKNEKLKLLPGDSFQVLNNKISQNVTQNNKPSWLVNTSEFKSIPLKEVLAEFERQYNITVNVKNIDTEQLFTGKFTHDDITIAIQSIAQPLNLKHTQKNKNITLTRE